MAKYVVEKDRILKCWILWKQEKNLKIEIFRCKYAKDCKAKKKELEAKRK